MADAPSCYCSSPKHNNLDEKNVEKNTEWNGEWWCKKIREFNNK